MITKTGKRNNFIKIDPIYITFDFRNKYFKLLLLNKNILQTGLKQYAILRQICINQINCIMYILLHTPSVNVTFFFNNREITTIYIYLNTVLGGDIYIYYENGEGKNIIYNKYI